MASDADTAPTTPGMETLSRAECDELLRATSVGRLAVDLAGRPEIFPINYLLTEDGIVFRTAAGTKLAGAALMHHVAFEIDGYEPADRMAWSIVVKGWARQVERRDDIERLEQLPLVSWAASPKPNFVCVQPGEVTGRRFHVGHDIATDASIGWRWPERNDDSVDGGLAVRPEPCVDYHPGAPRLHPD